MTAIRWWLLRAFCLVVLLALSPAVLIFNTYERLTRRRRLRAQFRRFGVKP